MYKNKFKSSRLVVSLFTLMTDDKSLNKGIPGSPMSLFLYFYFFAIMVNFVPLTYPETTQAQSV